MKKIIPLALTVLASIFLCSFNDIKLTKSELENDSAKLGKAYWYSYYNDGTDKKLYITQVYNTDCDHCGNEIKEAFKKWLILNDYENAVSKVNIDSLHDIDEGSLEKRRESTIIKYKGYDYTIVRVNFTYNE